MVDARTEDDTDLADAYDFTPPCEVDEPGGDEDRVSCVNPATWLGVPPCGHDGFFCDKHHVDDRAFMCRVCGERMLLATYKWIRL